MQTERNLDSYESILGKLSKVFRKYELIIIDELDFMFCNEDQKIAKNWWIEHEWMIIKFIPNYLN